MRGSDLLKGAARIAAATGAFAVVHSLLASRRAKRAAERLVGEKGRNALYRPFYLAQSFVTFGALVVYVWRQPSDTLYRIRGPAALLMRAGQAAGLGYAVYAARQVGIADMLGLRGLTGWIGGTHVPPEPEAQGPAPDEDGEMRASGPFRLHRHPLNFAPLPVLWLFPHMTTRLAALNLASTAYLVLGSVHEEVRLRAAYGDSYARYQASGVPFFIPIGRPPSLPRAETRPDEGGRARVPPVPTD